MTPSLRRYAARGFTLIELLIVVIIVAILAAIAIPQFSNSTNDAQEAALGANLSTMRSAIELYRVQHNNVFPGVAAATNGNASCTAAGGVLGLGGVNSAVAFQNQLLNYSDAQGRTCTVPTPDFRFGPYLRSIPTEPFNNDNTVNVDVAANAAAPAAGGAGWRFNTITGRFIINSATLDANNRPYWER